MIAPGALSTLMPLNQLRRSESACVVELIGDGAEVHRLAEMGLRVGATVRMIRPGAPCLLALDGKRLSIRLDSRIDILVATES